MLLLYIIISLYISWIWVDYFKQIDVFEGERTQDLIGTFFLGTSSVLIVHFVHFLVGDFFVFENAKDNFGIFIHNFLEVGLLEELSKLATFGIAYLILKKHITEPIDYVIYICLSALGFAAAENVQYFYGHGAEIIETRSILCSVGHMIHSSLMAYGILQVVYRKKPVYYIVIYVILAALSHGIYNFSLSINAPWLFKFACASMYFMVTVSIFSRILNNAINFSPHFSYDKSIVQDKLTSRILLYYFGVLVLQTIVSVISAGALTAFLGLISSVIFCTFIILVTALRLSRFKIRKDHWVNLSLELPFYIMKDEFGRYKGLKIRGEGYNEPFIHQFYKKNLYIIPISSRSTFLKSAVKSFIIDTYFLQNEDAIFEVTIHTNSQDSHNRFYLISKMQGEIMFREKHPIVGIYFAKHTQNDFENLKKTDFKLLEWCYLKPV